MDIIPCKLVKFQDMFYSKLCKLDLPSNDFMWIYDGCDDNQLNV